MVFMVYFLRCKRKILLVLLLSFSFFVVHDFAMPKMELEKSYTQDSKKIQISDEIHNSIHTLFAPDVQTPLLTPYVLVLFEKNWTVFGVTSNYNCVLERPPLS